MNIFCFNDAPIPQCLIMGMDGGNHNVNTQNKVVPFDKKGHISQLITTSDHSQISNLEIFLDSQWDIQATSWQSHDLDASLHF